MYLNRVPFDARQNCYGFKNLVKLEGLQTNFKITLGTRVFKKSCWTSRSLTGNRCFFQKNMLKKLQIKIKRKVVIKPKVKRASKLKRESKANQASHAKLSSQAKQESKPTSKSSKSSEPSSSYSKGSKLNTRNSTKRRRKASFGWVSGVQPREPRKSTKQSRSK